MASKKIIIGVSALAIVLGLLWVVYPTFLQKSSKFSEETILKPWIEVVASPVFVSNENGGLKRELKTGDEVEAGSFIEVAKRGEANIYFPDGSVARLDAETKLLIDAASYDPKSKTLVVKVQLLIGRVWSKIFSLATPESTWEVKTSNAVATVRGTSFSTKVNRRGVTSIAGGTNRVNVKPVINGVATGNGVIVEGGKMATLDKTIIQQITEGVLTEIPVVEQDTATRAGVAENLKDDEETESKQKDSSQNPNEFKRSVIEERANEPVLRQENSTTTLSEIFSEFKELRIANIPNKEIRVNSSVSFKAFLVRNDSTLGERDVTDEVGWLVRTAQSVSIGTITRQGVFTAKLDENSSEQSGFGEGFITASWKDSVTESIFRAQTPILKIFIPESFIPEGLTE